ncbi:5-formyltetrahydrofolate cyclo-ligase [Enterococcus sp. BWR-S5]|uniref:5-formyltetrahydrofolate cyclo-ligase n=1 Tax=Enterococcus sp. BWR-S5 TaxID=2787714 RepID=UPI0019233F5F|nr:5-formyltetrahydrofolate cyclo-ligase [Enterococcus sp. BWR-S5]MBL1227365.1 5-formyltetrahydrofolate cyclo-ligase [Enterococcus sp. BWR-S5]
MEKKKIRTLGLANLNWLYRNEALKKTKEQHIVQQLFADEYWLEAETIGVVKAVPFEFDTVPVIGKAWAEGKRVTVPKVENKEMFFHQITAESLFVRSSFGVEEPAENKEIPLAEIDLLIVPGLVFTTTGFRVGFGGGYYDRVLERFQGNSCSLVFSEQIQESWQAEAFDQRVNKLFIN